MGGTGSGLKRIVVMSLSFLMAVTLLSCGGGGGSDSGSAQFTAAMLDNQVFYRESFSSQERAIIHFNPGGVLLDRMMDNSGVTETSGTWSVDNTGVLYVTEGTDNVVITLVRDAANYMDVDVAVNSGSPDRDRLYKTVAFSETSLPGRYGVEDKELDGATALSGVAAVVVGGTGTFADGLTEESFTWDVLADGSLAADSGGGTDNLFLLAGGSYAGTLNVVVEDDDGSGFFRISNMKWTRVAAASGFDNAAVEGKTGFFENTAALERGLVHFQLGGGLSQSMQEGASIFDLSGTWNIGGAGTLYLDFGGGLVVGVILLNDTATYWDILSNDGNGLEEQRIYKTIPFPPGDVPDTYTFTFRGLNGATTDTGTITFAPGGTGAVSGGDSFGWTVNADGSMTMDWSSTPVVDTFYLLASSTTSTLTIVGEDYFSGVLSEVYYITLRR